MHAFWPDVRYAARLLRRTPSFAAIAILSLALGIGANTAVFSLLNAVVLRDLPVRHPEQLVDLTPIRPDGRDGKLSFPVFEELVRRQQVFSSLIGYWGDGIFNLEANGAVVRGDVWAVTGNFYSELGVTPFAGRVLTEQDVSLPTRSPARVAVLGYGVWQREFGGSLSIIGQPVRVEGASFTVIGIAPKGFTALGLTSEPDVTLPLTAVPLITTSPGRFTDLKSQWVDVVGRLGSGRGLPDARAQLASLWPTIRSAMVPPDYVGKERDDFLATRLSVASGSRGKEWFLRSRFTSPLFIMLGVGALILLIACVNLASLTLSRAAARSHEMALRGALGASRWRLARQMITEGLLLSGIGAVAGLLLASWRSRALAALMTRDYAVLSVLDVSPDARVLAFTAVVAVLTGVLFSLFPAWRASRHDPASGLRQRARTVAIGGRAGKILIVAQVALSLVLLMDAGLLVRTLHQLRAIDYGFRRDNIIVAALFPRAGGFKNVDMGRYEEDLAQRVAATPGVLDVAFMNGRTMGFESNQTVSPPSFDRRSEVVSGFVSVSPHLFRTLGVDVLAGRDFSWHDDSQGRVAIVSRSLATRLFAGGEALGRHIRVGNEPRRQDLEVVGIVGDVRLWNPRNPDASGVFVPMLQEGDSATGGDLIVRMAPGASMSASSLGHTVQSLGHESVSKYRTAQEVLDRAILQERVTAMLAAFFGALALLLAAVGLYGLMAYSVVQRTREIGIRVALGAQRTEVVTMVMGDTMRLVIVGVALGTPMALSSSRLVGSLLFGLAPGDPVTLAVIAGMLLAIGLVAGYLPGRRASRVDPIEALRSV
jgi:putative ABC transport system permease protein